MNSRHEEIQKLAHQLWESEGKPEGQSEKHWEKATILASETSDSGLTDLKKSIDPSEASGPTEPAQPDQT